MRNYLFAKAIDILKNDGAFTLLKRATAYFSGYLFRFRTYILYEHSIKERNEQTFRPKIAEFTFKVISTNHDVDKLVKEGFEDIRKVLVFVNVASCLDNGAIAFCFFVGTELAHIGWIALTEQAKNCFDNLPYHVNFTSKQACTGGTVTVPKYQGNGFMQYGYYQRFEYLRERGYTTTRNAVSSNNLISHKAHAKFAPTIYGKAYYIKILWRKWWKEQSVVS